MECEVCSAKVSELRRGRCWGCYSRWVDDRIVGLGGSCCICGERRRDTLKSVELLGAWAPMCYTCSGRAGKLQPMPQTIAGIRKALARDRRDEDRRYGKSDTRVFQHERRSGDRREGRPEVMDIDDEMILSCDELAESLDRIADEMEARRKDDGDLTRIMDAQPHL